MGKQQRGQSHTPRCQHGTCRHLDEGMLIPSRISALLNARCLPHPHRFRPCQKSCLLSKAEREARTGRCLLQSVMLEDIGYATRFLRPMQLLGRSGLSLSTLYEINNPITYSMKFMVVFPAWGVCMVRNVNDLCNARVA